MAKMLNFCVVPSENFSEKPFARDFWYYDHDELSPMWEVSSKPISPKIFVWTIVLPRNAFHKWEIFFNEDQKIQPLS